MLLFFRTIDLILEETKAIVFDDEAMFTQIHQDVMLTIGRRKSVTALYESTAVQLQSYLKPQ